MLPIPQPKPSEDSSDEHVVIPEDGFTMVVLCHLLFITASTAEGLLPTNPFDR